MVVNELRGEKIDIVPFSDDPADFVMKALSPAKVKEVRIHEDTGVAEVIVPDYQLSLAIGKEGQNARLAARLTGWRVDIKSETQLAEEEAYLNQDWAEGEWVIDPATGEQVWQSAEGGEAMSAEQWNEAAVAETSDEAPKAEETSNEAPRAEETSDEAPKAEAAVDEAPSSAAETSDESAGAGSDPEPATVGVAGDDAPSENAPGDS